jgi:DNA-binding NarL/FixJ family response regulator
MSYLSLLIVDDHPVYREAISEKLSQAFLQQGIATHAAASANDGLELISQPNRKWIVLLDILLPGLSGLAGIKAFKAHSNVDHVVAISGLDKHLWEPKTVAAGATLFLSKNSTSEHIYKKIHALLETQSVTSNQELAQESKEFRLTARQLEVLTWVAQGHPNKVIADYMEISEQTVKIHINQIFKELRVFNRTQAVLKAQKNNLL